MFKSLKYLMAYTLPLVAWFGLSRGGLWYFAPAIYAFGIIPIFETLLAQDGRNLGEQEKEKLKIHPIFDWMLYLNVPMVYGILLYGLVLGTSLQLSTISLIGLISAIGITMAVNGINVGHELGHRNSAAERFLGKLLLLPSLYLHFYLEHNKGHHLYVATPKDPATARYNQSVYHFWVSSVLGQYFSAWRLQRQILKAEEIPFLSLRNHMFWSTVAQIAYLAGIWLAFGMLGALIATGAAVVSFLMLETVNYIEHYGLRRQLLPSGRYERTTARHSWNSNHTVGRIVLYELTRHSDHHARSNKKYQLLDCKEEAPQLPYGYPTSMVLSLIPGLWFSIMNRRVPTDMLPETPQY